MRNDDEPVQSSCAKARNMIQCSRCGGETVSFDLAVPICHCEAERQSDHDKIRDAINNNLEIAKQHRNGAYRRLAATMYDGLSAVPSPDGTHRIQQALIEYRDALEAVAVASRKLSDFLSNGTGPFDVNSPKAAEDSATALLRSDQRLRRKGL